MGLREGRIALDRLHQRADRGLLRIELQRERPLGLEEQATIDQPEAEVADHLGRKPQRARQVIVRDVGPRGRTGPAGEAHQDGDARLALARQNRA